MANGIAVWFGFVAVVIMLASVVGTVERRERYTFGVGVLLILGGLTILPSVQSPGALTALVALVGFLAIFASVVPLLRE